jgi:hypothetical protein
VTLIAAWQMSGQTTQLLRLTNSLVLQISLEAIELNDKPAQAAMLKLNVREAWETLKMRVAELEASSDIEGISTAVEEASALVQEIGAAFQFS